MSEYEYDLVVIGTGPSGQKAAVQGAKAGKRVAIIDKKEFIGGVCVNTGTIPSKTLREAVLYLSGYRERNIYGASYRVKESITMDDLRYRCDHVMHNEMDVIQHQMQRNHIKMIHGFASFHDPHALTVRTLNGDQTLKAAHIVIAVGTKPTRHETIPFVKDKIFTSDGLLEMDEVPKTLAVIGGGGDWSGVCQYFCSLGCAGDGHRYAPPAAGVCR